jgi:hypothetical protein
VIVIFLATAGIGFWVATGATSSVDAGDGFGVSFGATYFTLIVGEENVKPLAMKFTQPLEVVN